LDVEEGMIEFIPDRSWAVLDIFCVNRLNGGGDGGQWVVILNTQCSW